MQREARQAFGNRRDVGKKQGIETRLTKSKVNNMKYNKNNTEYTLHTALPVRVLY